MEALCRTITGLGKKPDRNVCRSCGEIITAGVEQINGKWYIFYHRPTNRTQFSRQGCAEPIIFSEDGKIVQAEMTSQGLNGKPLDGKGTYPAAIACILHGKEELGISRPYTLGQPYVTQDMPDFSPEKSMQQTENKETYLIRILHKSATVR